VTVPILRQGTNLIVTLQSALTDKEFLQLQDDVVRRVGVDRCRGVVLDVSTLDVVDSYAARVLRSTVQMVHLRGAEGVIVGIQPAVAFTMVQLGLTLDGVATALDLDEGLLILARRAAGGRTDVDRE
jgi:rsbT antagonist protein RsbS